MKFNFVKKSVIAFILVFGIFEAAFFIIEYQNFNQLYFGLDLKTLLLFIYASTSSIFAFGVALLVYKKQQALFQIEQNKVKELERSVSFLNSEAERINGLEKKIETQHEALLNHDTLLESLEGFREKTESWLHYISPQSSFADPPRALLEQKDIKGFFDKMDETAYIVLYSIYRGQEAGINLHHAMFRFYLAPVGLLRREMIEPELINWFNQFSNTLIMSGLLTSIREIKIDERLIKIIKDNMDDLLFQNFELRELFKLIKKTK